MNRKQSVFTISLDFELYWGIRDIIDLDSCKDNLRKNPLVVESLLALFEKYDIHTTWATVGFMFYSSKEELLQNLPNLKPEYVNKSLSPYYDVDKVGDSELVDPYHFAPSLIKRIIDTPNQELASHTFSHYYCLEKGQTRESFGADISQAIKAGNLYNRNIASIVFPRNQYSNEYLEICSNLGILAYRGNEHAWFYATKERHVSRQVLRRLLRLADAYLNISGANSFSYPDNNSLPVNIPSSRYLRPYSKRLSFLDPLRFRRIVSSMKHAAENGQVFHLWWHPEELCQNTQENLEFLEGILKEYKNLQSEYGMISLSMGEIANEVLRKKNNEY